MSQQVAIVTGAARGIGRAIAQRLLADGTQVVLADIDLAAARQTVRELDPPGSLASAEYLDTGDIASIRVLVGGVAARLGRISILVNNAGIIDPAPALEMSEAQWDRVVDVDLKGLFFCSQEVARHMRAQGEGGGSIVNIASVAAARALPGRANYCAAKAGVVAITGVLALEWAEYGIRVNAVAPGYIHTELQQRALRVGLNDLRTLQEAIPQKRLGEASEIAEVVAFLASDRASYVTGQTFYADGGWLLVPAHMSGIGVAIGEERS